MVGTKRPANAVCKVYNLAVDMKEVTLPRHTKHCTNYINTQKQVKVNISFSYKI